MVVGSHASRGRNSFRSALFVLPALLVLLALGCGDDDAPADAAGTDTGADAGDDTGCTPIACSDVDEGCGMHSDQCGGMLDCGNCGCETDADCPSRPCETVTCDASVCVSTPISCGGEACTCVDDECDALELRACGGACGIEACDPSPMTVAGEVVYLNQCVPNEGFPCGLCGLGGLVCDGDGAITCDDIRVPLLARPELAECDDTLPESTFLYLDPEFTLADGETSDGSRARPYLDLDMAVLAAQSRGAFAIIIGGSPTFAGPLEVTDGIAIFGGFSNAPHFDRDSNAWPVVQVGAADIVEQRLVALSATDLALATRVEHLRLVTDDVSAESTGATSAGVFINNSPAFELANMRIEVGPAATGVDGEPGRTPTFTFVGAGSGGAASSGGCNTVARGEGGNTTTCDGFTRGTIEQRGAPGARSGGSQPVDLPDYDTRAGVFYAFYVQGSDSNDRFVEGGERTQMGGSSANPTTFTDGAGGTGTTGRTGSRGTTSAPRIMPSPADGFPLPISIGATGGRGGEGGGGSGGSSGLIVVENGLCRGGGGGGGGGAGGCGGLGGLGGGPGGWVVGVVVVGSSDSVLIEELQITLGAPGAGGVGGAGAPGTPGAPGGSGGSGSLIGPGAFWNGGTGGAGGTGGTGGAGGAGSPGRSVGVYSTVPVPGLDADSLNLVDADIEVCDDGLCCESAEIICGGRCVSPTNNEHCGTCDNDCGEFGFCNPDTMMCES